MLGLNPRCLINQTRAALAREIAPEPLVLHAAPVLQLRQEQDVNKRPDEPRNNYCEPDSARIQKGKILADHRHVALVEVSERTRRFTAAELSGDPPSDVPALLDCDLRYPRQRSTVLYHGRGLADDEYPGSIGDVQKWDDACPASSVGRRAEHLDDRRRRDACCPQYRAAIDPLPADGYALIIDEFDHCAGDHFHSE